MLCTVVWETYRSDERREVHEALDSLLAEGSPDWSRRGLYGYWDPAQRQLLYLGLARDLPSRFAQHNGVIRHSGGNKREQIDAWFDQHEMLGLTTLVQAAAVEMLGVIQDLSPTMGVKPDEIIGLAEGQVIELHRKVTGSWPAWNGTSGASRGRELALDTGQTLIPVLSAARDSMFVARRALRDLARDAGAQQWEAAIHTARMRAVLESHEVRGVPPDDMNRTEATRRIQLLLLVRSGHLVDDLAPTDADVIEMLRKIQDGRARLEYAEQARALTTLMPDVKLPGDKAVGELLQMVTQQGQLDAPREAQVVTELLEQGYLSESPDLRCRGGAGPGLTD